MPRCLAPSLLRNTRALRTVKGASPSVGQRDVETLRVVIAAHSDPKVEGDPPTGGHSQRATRGCARYESSPLASSNPAHERPIQIDAEASAFGGKTVGSAGV